jgi:4-hydroxybenzoate polyprenyltransferase
VLHYLKILRPNNLFIIVVTQVLIRYCVLEPLLFTQGLALQMPVFDFVILVLTSVLIASAGYVINDYFDVKIDRLNRPDTVIVDRIISRRKSMLWHLSLNGLGLVGAVIIAWRAQNLQLVIIQILTIGLLWFYSTDFKKQALIGNLVVAFLTALIPMVVIIYELPWLKHFYENTNMAYQLNFKSTLQFVAMFALFAFLMNLMREIIKDIEDVFGDEAAGCKTLPIVFGIDKTKYFVYITQLITIAILVFVIIKNHSPNDIIPSAYLALLIGLPLLFASYKVYKANQKNDFSFISRLLKVIMVLGLGFTFIIYYLVHYGNIA